MKKIDKDTDKNAHTDLVKGLAMSPTGHGMLSASFDGTVKLWCA